MSFHRPDPASRGDRWLGDPEMARFWDAASDLAMPIAFHVVVRENEANPLYPYLKNADVKRTGGLISTFLGLEVMMAFSQMLSDGIFAEHPRLKLAVLETGSVPLDALERHIDAWIVAQKKSG